MGSTCSAVGAGFRPTHGGEGQGVHQVHEQLRVPRHQCALTWLQGLAVGWVEGVGCFSAGAGCGHARQYRPVKESGMAPGAQASVDLHLYGCRNYLQAGTWQWRPAGVGASDVQIHGMGQLQVHTLARAVRGTGTSTQCVSHCGCLGCWPGLVSCRGQRRACTQQRRAATGISACRWALPQCWF